MKKTLSLALMLFASTLLAQTQIQTQIDPSRATTVYRIALPLPDMIPKLGGGMVPNPEDVRAQFFAPLSRDIVYSGFFALASLPPGIAVTPDVAKRAGAQLLLKLNVFVHGQDHVVDAELVDTTGARQWGGRYRAAAGALPETAHMVGNEVVRAISGRPGVFRTRIAFASDRSGAWEIWLMDWDGLNQRPVTRHNLLSILPSWSPDNERLVYTSFHSGTSDMYVINRRGGGRIRLETRLNLNTSATFSPAGSDIAFVGSVSGNPDIYLIRDDGSNLRRLTSASSIESTPEWSPDGRQITFTSGRSGTPQIYVMDSEGANERRISYEGDWNDDATWSPDGERIAYTSRVSGRFQIRVANLVTGQSNILAGEGSNEQPTWSPDGQWIAFQSNRSGKWQVYRMRVDGTDLLQLTFNGENKGADWSKKAE
jgi:TolB protein